MTPANVVDLAARKAERKRASIMVIDDDQSMRELVRLHLSNAGYEVRIAEDAVVGGRMLLERAPDLIICDVDMPYMSGYDFVAALRTDATKRDIPVVFLTVKDDVADQAKKLGAVAYLMKPVMADRLLEVVRLFVN
ncbi:MAG TPA: response regulator [Burkholderiales bacterium]